MVRVSCDAEWRERPTVERPAGLEHLEQAAELIGEGVATGGEGSSAAEIRAMVDVDGPVIAPRGPRTAQRLQLSP